MSRDCYKSFLRRSGNVYILYNNKNTEENIYHAAVRPTKTPITCTFTSTQLHLQKSRDFYFQCPRPRMQQTDSWLVSQNQTAGKCTYSNHWSHADATKSSSHSHSGGSLLWAQAGIHLNTYSSMYTSIQISKLSVLCYTMPRASFPSFNFDCVISNVLYLPLPRHLHGSRLIALTRSHLILQRL